MEGVGRSTHSFPVPVSLLVPRHSSVQPERHIGAGAPPFRGTVSKIRTRTLSKVHGAGPPEQR